MASILLKKKKSTDERKRRYQEVLDPNSAVRNYGTLPNILLTVLYLTLIIYKLNGKTGLKFYASNYHLNHLRKELYPMNECMCVSFSTNLTFQQISLSVIQ